MPGNLRRWGFGLVLLAAVLFAATHFADIEDFARISAHSNPLWLLVAVALQAATYVCVAVMWFVALDESRLRLPVGVLGRLAVAKLFTDQALPSGGISGTTFLIAALSRRRVPASVALAVTLLAVVTYYAAYLIAAIATFLVLWLHHAVSAWIVTAVGVFSLVATAVPALILYLSRAGPRFAGSMRRFPALQKFAAQVADAPLTLLRTPRVAGVAFLGQLSIFVLDALTLWAVLWALGNPVSVLVAFPAFMLGSIAGTLGPVPMGLGAFEGACISMLTVLGVPVEAALAGTLLLRGLTLWLPMIPGMIIARREMVAAR
ncbi:MAG: lysylphosphatidylglycerol synthase transmembrane domain-containing protein [Pseudomonadales bacterium]